jgi:predicted RNase H-like HicB family nuclease
MASRKRAMSDLRYEVRIWWSSLDKLYLAEAPELPGCITHGRSYERALARLRELIPFWLDVADEFNIPYKTPRVRRLPQARRSRAQTRRRSAA